MSRIEPLLKDLDAAFAEFEESISGLAHPQMLERWFGEWCVYDICSHIIGWHHELDDALERISRGEKPVPEGVSYDDSDAWNAKFIETWVQSSGAAVLEELPRSKKLFVEAARQVPDERYEEGRAAYRILLGSGTDHYRDHAAEIREWRERQGI